MTVRTHLSDADPLPGEDTSVEYEDDLTQEEWDEIAAMVDEEELRGEKPIFNSGDYATHEEADAALEAMFDSILQKVMNGHDTASTRDAENSSRHDGLPVVYPASTRRQAR